MPPYNTHYEQEPAENGASDALEDDEPEQRLVANADSDAASATGSVDGLSSRSDSEDEDLDDEADEHELQDALKEQRRVTKGKEKILKPLTPEALAAFEEAQRRAGIIYISRIPPGMRPQKLRQLMSAYGEVGRIYLVPEDSQNPRIRKRPIKSNRFRFIEGWVEFADKHVARSVAEHLNAQPVGGKRGSRLRDELWTMKYLPKFKWNMLTEQLMHDKAARTARLRIELSQSKQEQEQYLKQVNLAKTLEGRAKRKKKGAEERSEWTNERQGPQKKPRLEEVSEETVAKEGKLKAVLGKIF